MRKRRLLVGLIAPAALFLLVGALATLQYHWVGQVSEADREQLRELLNRRVGEFTADFDREITQIYQGLQPGPGKFDPGAPEVFASKHEQWKAAARHPEIVKAIYFSRPTPNGTDLYKFDPSLRTFETAEWPASLESIKARLPGILDRIDGARSGTARVFTYSTPVVTDVPAILIPIPETVQPLRETARPAGSPSDFFVALHLSHSQLIVELDGQVLRESMLAALAARHFPETGADRYRVSILDSKSEPVLTRGLAEGERIETETADVTASFFGLRLETVRDATVSWTATGRGGATSSKSGRAVTIEPLSPGTKSFSMLVEQRSTAAAQGSPAVRLGVPATWKLLLQHSAGSLDAAVAEVRRRNLLLSFSILAVLVVSVGLIVVNARRSERLAAQQMDFVATVSHELRTPLAVIRSAAQNLSAGVISDSRQAQRYGDLIEGEGKRLTDMVEQVLEYAGLSGNRQPALARVVDVGALVQDVVSASSGLFEAEGFEVSVDVPPNLPAVAADEGAIRRALQNLVSNALKYAADGRWIGIAVRPETSRSGPEVQIAVSDRGRGIAADDLAHIFEPFYRGRYALERQIHGNGLGLSLVRRIAEAHGGRITVASSAGAGSTFTLHVPAAAPESASTRLDAPASQVAGPSA
jgi:signal transduction histidine kinase